MSDNKKYYYIRLKENFFDTEEMLLLEDLEDGYKYSNILLKLYLRSLKNDGKLMYKDCIPYSASLISKVTGHSIGDVERALKAFQELKLIERLENGAIYMLDIQNFIGESTTEADRKKAYRKRIADEKEPQNLYIRTNVQTNVQSIVDKRTPEIEIELDLEKEKEIEKEINTELKKEIQEFGSKEPSESNKLKSISQKKEFDLIISNFTEDKYLKNCIYDFIEMRKGIKKPITTKGLELMVKKLGEMTFVVSEQIKILENSIQNSWNGIFPIKQDNNKKQVNGFEELLKKELGGTNIWND